MLLIHSTQLLLHIDEILQGTFHNSSTVYGSGFYYQPTFVHINPLDSVKIFISANLGNSGFIAGSSVVVIWPVAGGWVTADSAFTNITFYNDTAQMDSILNISGMGSFNQRSG